MCFYTLISLIPPSKHFSCPSIFWGMWTCLELYPGVLFLSAPCSVHGSAAWQHSTMKDLMHRASGEFREKRLYLELHAERDWKQVQAPKGCSRADLGNPGRRSQGRRQQSSHERGLVFTLYWTEREHRAHCVCWGIHNFLVLMIFLCVSSFENMDWQRRDSNQEKASWYVPLGCALVGMCHWMIWMDHWIMADNFCAFCQIPKRGTLLTHSTTVSGHRRWWESQLC